MICTSRELSTHVSLKQALADHDITEEGMIPDRTWFMGVVRERNTLSKHAGAEKQPAP